MPARAAGFDIPPAPAPVQPLLLPLFAQTSLTNGMALVVVERRGLPLVTAMLSVRAGSLSDPPGKSGLAELSFGVLGKGARRGNTTADASALAYAADALGSGIEISTGAQASRLSMTVMSNRLGGSLALLADVLRTPTLPAHEIASSRLQLQETIRLEATDPGALASALAWRLYWGDTPAGRLSTEQSLARIRREDVINFCRQQLRPEQTTLVLAGDLDLAQGKALAERYFGSWRSPRSTSTHARPELSMGPQALGPSTLLVDLPGSGQSTVLLLAPYPPHPPLRSSAAERSQLRIGALASAVLGAGYSSRVNQQVRIKRGLSYGAYSSAESLPAGGLLLLSSQTKHQNASEVADVLRSELLRLATEPVPEEELSARRAGLIGEFARQMESTQTIAGMAAEQLERGESLADLASYSDELGKVSAEQLQALAQQYWRPQAVRSVVVGDLTLAGEGLRQQYPDAWVIPAIDLDLSSDSLRRPAKRH
ncbi:M16 family metallopeptidase [Roseateles oligotrophus]|uniref:Insulinase family protein n=1 Tax=Roseateles oligotrophus TaxID=1769250 RepID=A0ABT2YKQ4_9BURK|nr:pitrilysin family protein [Roseateles oligotrophus]MCV2370642.1 insulinase family protein [Roseateles oligotrophus]